MNINLYKYPHFNDEVDTLSVNSILKLPFHLISRLNTHFIILLNVYEIWITSEGKSVCHTDLLKIKSQNQIVEE